MKTKLTLFTAPWIIRHVRLALLARLFGKFAPLMADDYRLPRLAPDNDCWPDALPWTVERAGGLPDGVLQALHQIEAAAHPLPIPNPGQPDDSAPDRLTRAIEDWLAAPQTVSACGAPDSPGASSVASPK